MDKNNDIFTKIRSELTKKVMTYKSGKFVFSNTYSTDIRGKIFETIMMTKTISELPIMPKIINKIINDMTIHSIHSTAAIEGNPLTEEEVKEIVLEKKTRGNKKNNYELEIQNLKETYDFLAKQIISDKPIILDEEFIKSIHGLITIGIDDEHGKYRNHKVKVSDKEHGGVYTPPKIFDDITKLMREFVEWINSDEILNDHPFLRAAIAHYHLALIHPFGDGNGRTARMLEAIILHSAGEKYMPLMMSNYYYKNTDEYYSVFNKARKSKTYDITPFLEFFLDGYIENAKKIESILLGHIRIMMLEKHYENLKKEKKLTQRQFDLLNLLIEHEAGFNLSQLFTDSKFSILYRNVTKRTAQRDIEKLLQMNLIIQVDSRVYTINNSIV